MVVRVDPERRTLASFDETKVPFDLLVTVPLNMGSEAIAASGLGNDLNLVPVDKFTQQSKAYSNIIAEGDANDIPAFKAGSVAHFEIEPLPGRFPSAIGPMSLLKESRLNHLGKLASDLWKGIDGIISAIDPKSRRDHGYGRLATTVASRPYPSRQGKLRCRGRWSRTALARHP